MTEAHEGLSLLWKHPSSLPATDMEDQCGTNGVSYVTDCMAPTPEQPSAQWTGSMTDVVIEEKGDFIQTCDMCLF